MLTKNIRTMSAI